ncbi:MAG: hypothetical protein H6684_16835 [Deltaproteobacteria bacterium]|nr:hypothetical protein [Deltaproteobacteria bacterium]
MNPEISQDETIETPAPTGSDLPEMTDAAQPSDEAVSTDSPAEPSTDEPTKNELADLISRLESAAESLESAGLDPEQRSALADAKRVDSLAKERDAWKQQALKFKGLFQESTVRRLLNEAAQEAGAYKATQIVDLLTPKVTWSKDGASPVLVLAIGDEGPTTYPEGKFVDGVRSYLAENPNLAKSRAGGGAGSISEAGYGPVDTPRSLAELRLMRPLLEEKARLAR